jgi:hypothetical protein
MLEKIVVIAFKFNDILYASCTPEFQVANRRVIIILADKLAREKFPYLDLFDEVHYYQVPSTRIDQIFLASKIARQHGAVLDKSMLFIANPYIILIQLIILFGRVSRGVMIEDGVMNYYLENDRQSFDLLRKIQYRFFELCGLWKRFEFAYLLQPEKAVRYLGQPRKLYVNRNITSDRSFLVSSLLNEKSILVGGGAIEFLDPQRKKALVEAVCNQLKIDFYVPHHTDTVGAFGVDLLIVSDESLTLEMVYPYCTALKVYSFGSTASFNSKRINSTIVTVYLQLQIKEWMSMGFDKLMIESHDIVMLVYANGEIKDLEWSVG